MNSEFGEVYQKEWQSNGTVEWPGFVNLWPLLCETKLVIEG